MQINDVVHLKVNLAFILHLFLGLSNHESPTSSSCLIHLLEKMNSTFMT